MTKHLSRILSGLMLLAMLTLAGCSGGDLSGTSQTQAGAPAPAAPATLAQTNPTSEPPPAEAGSDMPAGFLGRGFPSIVINPSSAAPGTTVNLTITGGDPYSQVKLMTTDPNGVYTSRNVSTDSSGTGRTTWVATTPYGYWRFQADNYGYVGNPVYCNVTTNPTSGGSTAFSVSASPSTAAVGSNVTLTVQGAYAYSTLRVYRRDPNGTTYTNYRYADGSGNATYTWVTGNPAGAWSVWAEDDFGRRTSTITVTLTTSSTPALGLTRNLSSATVGQQVTFTVTGGYPNGYIYLYQTPPGGSATYTTLTSNSSGTATFAWTAASPTGTWNFYARDPYGRTSATVTVSVTASSGGGSAGGTLAANKSSVSASGDRYVTFTLTGAPANSPRYLGRSTTGQAVQYDYMGTTDSTGRLVYNFDSYRSGVYVGTNNFWASSTNNYTTGVRSNTVQVLINY